MKTRPIDGSKICFKVVRTIHFCMERNENIRLIAILYVSHSADKYSLLLEALLLSAQGINANPHVWLA